MPEQAYVPPGELVDRGYLQELNRRFLHPLGMALEVQIAEEGAARLLLTDAGLAALERLVAAAREAALIPSTHLDDLDALIAAADRVEAGDGWLVGVRDERDDAEGVVFAAEVPLGAKAEAVEAEWVARSIPRGQALGYVVQPVEGHRGG